MFFAHHFKKRFTERGLVSGHGCMDELTTEHTLIGKLRGLLMYLAYYGYFLSMGVL